MDSTVELYCALRPPPWRGLRAAVTSLGQGQPGHSPVETVYRFMRPSSLWFCDLHQQSRFLTACRRLEKLILPSILTQNFHYWWCETCRVIQQQFWMKECDFFCEGRRVRTYTVSEWVSKVYRPHQHIIGHFGYEQWLKWFCEAGGLTWRSQVGANPIPIPTPLIWRYLGIK